MSTINFDTDDAIQRLRQRGMPEDQAREIVHVVWESQRELVTKQDLDGAIKELKLWTGKLMASGVVFLTVVIGLATAAQHFWQ